MRSGTARTTSRIKQPCLKSKVLNFAEALNNAHCWLAYNSIHKLLFAPNKNGKKGKKDEKWRERKNYVLYINKYTDKPANVPLADWAFEGARTFIWSIRVSLGV